MFYDRTEAGRQLAAELLRQMAEHGWERPVVLALPRGGVPVAVPVAQALNAPLDLLLVRKIGAPGNPELAVGAVAEGNPPVIVSEDDTLYLCGCDRDYIEREALPQIREIARRRQLYLHGEPRVPLDGCTVIVVDDGLATGASARAALHALRASHPARLVLAVPVAPPQTVAALRGEVDALVCLQQPEFFGGVGAHYRDFHQVPDDEVIRLLDEARRPPGAPGAGKPR